jgi:hypothetical protein
MQLIECSLLPLYLLPMLLVACRQGYQVPRVSLHNLISKKQFQPDGWQWDAHMDWHGFKTQTFANRGKEQEGNGSKEKKSNVRKLSTEEQIETVQWSALLAMQACSR